MTEHSDTNFDNAANDAAWQLRFKGRVASLSHAGDTISVVVQLYSQPRPPENEFSRKAAPADEQLLYFGTVDQSVHLSLRIAARRTSPATAAVSVEVRSNRLPHLHEPGHLSIALSADDTTFTASTALTYGTEFTAVPIVALGSLRVDVECRM